MKNTVTYRPWLAALLALLIVQVTLLRDLHHLLPHQHEHVPHCDSDSAHLHTAEYAHVDCLICFFHIAPVDFQEEKLTLHAPEITEAKSEFTYHTLDLRPSRGHNFLRGPPLMTA